MSVVHVSVSLHEAVACSLVEGSLGFLTGLVTPAELIPLARQHRDKMLTKVTSCRNKLITVVARQ